ncbi:methyl-accepting chemotaxis protein [Vitiosangium sp. GDMCC 1.1324]|uniref:methyl-accepting chemotaxis protein n=1 Tax=Vitiosangium sp. (strain GDMCC 1.1324) TaxID=2138576 RepID=UPI000D390103|nr:methyl-accepting chemotaxis protein [Vitiosangium sp. GDMCC 1.1324]PTL77388.1 methyl-accepting chemotaxis protein [Vitiosangium sp. GDMCC 1.1324]
MRPPTIQRLDMRRLSLRTKMVAITGASGALVTVILVAVFSLQMRDSLKAEFAKRAAAASHELAHHLAIATWSRDEEGLRLATAATLRNNPDVAYVVVRDRQGDILGHATVARLVSPALLPALAPQASQRELYVGGRPVLETSSPVFFEPRAPRTDGAQLQVGSVQVGLELDVLNQAVSRMALRGLGLGLLALVGCLVAVAWLCRMLIIPLERLALAAAGMASGDLRQQIDSSGTDEVGDLARSFATMAEMLTNLLKDLRGAAADMEREATNVLGTSSQQSAMANEQASAIHETGATVAEIAQTSKQATSFADTVISGTSRSDALSAEGQKVVDESVAAMEKLSEQVKAIALAITDLNEQTLQIGDIITTVKDVAEQSNLLALNASIEAAKAGDQGRGFAVVAMEMRTLAEQSKMAANQVRALLGEVQKGTRAAVTATEEGSRRALAAMELAQSAGAAIKGLSDLIRESSSAARQIAGNTRQQTIGVEQIAAAMNELTIAMQDNVEGTKRIEQVAGNLSNLSKRFSDLVGKYQL